MAEGRKASKEEMNAAMGQAITKAWSDEAYKQRLLDDTGAALGEVGLTFREGFTMKAVENTADTVYLVLPAPPPEGELSDEALDKVAGGTLGLLIDAGVEIGEIIGEGLAAI